MPETNVRLYTRFGVVFEDNLQQTGSSETYTTLSEYNKQQFSKFSEQVQWASSVSKFSGQVQ